MNAWFDEQIEINKEAGINLGIVFFFEQKSPNAKLHAQKACYGVSQDSGVQKIIDRYPTIDEIYERYEFVNWTSKFIAGSNFPFPVLKLKLNV